MGYYNLKVTKAKLMFRATRKEAELTSPQELVVLLDDTGNAIGTRAKHEVHDEHTPRHLAFSCYLFDAQGRVLITRRALSKIAWPGVWTNSFCGHPGPGEDFFAAIARRADDELGTAVTHIECQLPEFSYRAVDISGIVENELCPVFTATIAASLDPAPDEVCDWRWVLPEDLYTAINATPFAFSPWMGEQLAQLKHLGAIAGRQTDG